MNPDFNKITIETLAKRAGYKCSNPDCKVNTIGPNSDPEKSTKIGEAAHIFGARIGSKRFNNNMTDYARSEITNSIWLCRNCHKLIDSDDLRYSANILFAWREKHEEFISSSLGNNTDQILLKEQIFILKDFDEYPPLIKRIIIDKPFGWEYRLTSELMRFLNKPLFRKLDDLKEGLYLKPLESIKSDQASEWIVEKITELRRMLVPAAGLLDRLTKSWGKPGEQGDLNEIHHITKLIKAYLEYIIDFEERIRFVHVPPKYERAVNLLQDLIGSQILKLSSIPADLDEIVLFAENLPKENTQQKEIKKVIVFDVPEYWNTEFSKELAKIYNH